MQVVAKEGLIDNKRKSNILTTDPARWTVKLEFQIFSCALGKVPVPYPRYTNALLFHTFNKLVRCETLQSIYGLHVEEKNTFSRRNCKC